MKTSNVTKRSNGILNTANLTAKTPPLKVGAWNCLPLKIGIPRVTEKVSQPSIYRGELAVTFAESTRYPPFVCFSWRNLVPTSLTSSQHLPGSSTLPKNNPPDRQPTHHFLRHFFLFKTWPTKTHTQKRRAQKTFPYPTGSRTCRPCFPHLPPLGGWTSTSRWPTLCHRAGLQGQHGREDEIRKKLFFLVDPWTWTFWTQERRFGSDDFPANRWFSGSIH